MYSKVGTLRHPFVSFDVSRLPSVDLYVFRVFTCVECSWCSVWADVDHNIERQTKVSYEEGSEVLLCLDRRRCSFEVHGITYTIHKELVKCTYFDTMVKTKLKVKIESMSYTTVEII